MKGGDKQEGKNVRRKSVFRWDPGGKNPFEREREREKREKGLDRVELRSWMENAPRNIPGIVWEQFSRQPRTDVIFPLRYKSPEVAGPQQTATALPRASSTLKRSLLTPRETTSKQVKRDKTTERAREYLRTPPKTRLTFPKNLGPGFLLKTQKKIYPRC